MPLFGGELRKDCVILHVLCCISHLGNASSPPSVLASPIQKPLLSTASFPGEVYPGNPMDLMCWQCFSWGLLLGVKSKEAQVGTVLMPSEKAQGGVEQS